MKFYNFIKLSGAILILVLCVWLLVFITSEKVNHNTEIKPIVFGYNIDTTNVRIQQWIWFYRNVDPIDSSMRAFYYSNVVGMLVDAGFSEPRAKIYAEIPGVECNWEPTRYPETSSAKGLWQFTEGRAKALGLMGKGFDYRMDPYKSTWAAASGFQELEQAFDHDLTKILFAYHAGEGVLTEMKRLHRTSNAWLYEFPNRETYNYCPKVLGLAYVNFLKECRGQSLSKGN
jgi:hypothetical protein